MPHDNRRQIRVPRRLWDEMMLALYQALGQIEVLAAREQVREPDAGGPGIVTRQIHEFGQRVLAEARRRERNSP